MTKRMLIDATHAEETRVVVLDGNQLEDFDVETAAKKQLKGNIYLAKVVRVEPSLQAAFVEYGGGRHGFLAFGEIHPDYYQIPVADRQRLLAIQEAEARAEEEAEDAAAAAAEAAGEIPAEGFDAVEEAIAAPVELGAGIVPDEAGAANHAEEAGGAEPEPPLPFEEVPQTSLAAAVSEDMVVAREEAGLAELPPEPTPDVAAPEVIAADLGTDTLPEFADAPVAAAEPALPEPLSGDSEAEPSEIHAAEATEHAETHAPDQTGDGPAGETGSHDAAADEGNGDEPGGQRPQPRFMRSYKIQEVIRRRQILLVQVVKEERGTKGAALTTYISLAGRFSVLMPNSPRGGGISRKITSAADRRRLKEVTAELQIPRGMGLIVRTAGAARPKAEIMRDCEYLLDLWDSIRETTMVSVAPALIHEEANLIRRAIRDNYSRDIDEVMVDGEAGWRAARDFMRMLMPAHARKVILWNEPQPLFARHGVEAQLDSMLQPVVQLRSGGYLVINQTEALVAIDVNSGRSTRERGIEETALKTNLEAADEVARQLRLRDLAGLIVIDFIDMEQRRNNAAVEKRMKEALRDDRARIQMGAISHFGLMELSRQRLRPSLAETSFTTCPHCGGTGHIRTTEMAALAVLRQVEDEGAKRRAAAIMVYVAGAVALYILNHKRVRLAEIETRHGMSVAFAADDTLMPPEIRIERLRAPLPGEAPAVPALPAPVVARDEDDLAVEAEDEVSEDAADARAEAEEEGDAARAGETAEEAATRVRRRRRRRRGGRREEGETASVPAARLDPALADQPDLTTPPPPLQTEPEATASWATPEGDEPVAEGEGEAVAAEPGVMAGAEGDEESRSRRRGRRGGRRRRREPREDGAAPGYGDAEAASFEDGGELPAIPSPVGQTTPAYTPAAYTPAAYTGPTPANPFGGEVFDLFAIMDEPDPPVAPAPPPIVAPIARPEREAEAAEATVPADEPAASVAEATTPAEAEPQAAAELDQTLAMANGHAEPAPPPEPVSTPVPPPVLVGVGEPATEKKRGWWRR